MSRIGLLGTADPSAETYMRALRCAGADVVGLFDGDVERGAQVGRLNGVRVLPTAESLLDEVDAVLICAETLHHRGMVELACAAGSAILCGGLLGVSVADSKFIVDLCRQQGVALMPAFPLRFDPAAQRIRDLVAIGDLGVVCALSGVNRSVMPHRSPMAGLVDRPQPEGDTMIDQVVHLADAYSWILRADPEEVYAVGNQIVHPEVTGLKTSGLVIVSYPDGVFGSIDCSFNRPAAYPARSGWALSVVGDGGTADAEPLKQHLTQFDAMRVSWVPWRADAHVLMMREFLACVSEKRPPCVTDGDGVRATRVALGARQSLGSGVPVSLSVR
jgi:predicted dehydrogenase